MTAMIKSAAAAALIGALAIASATPGEARNRWIGPAAAGFAAGAIVGGVAANAYGPRYYEPGYAYSSSPGYAYSSSPGYAYSSGSGYAYGSGYDAYAYEPAPVYAAPRYYRSRSGSNGCNSQGNYGQSVDESACNR